jgi:5-formyltetrahydrofolate cyclo-ligase
VACFADELPVLRSGQESWGMMMVCVSTSSSVILASALLMQPVVEDCVHLDVLLMPGLGFDLQGRRIGRGGG